MWVRLGWEGVRLVHLGVTSSSFLYLRETVGGRAGLRATRSRSLFPLITYILI